MSESPLDPVAQNQGVEPRSCKNTATDLFEVIREYIDLIKRDEHLNRLERFAETACCAIGGAAVMFYRGVSKSDNADLAISPADMIPKISGALLERYPLQCRKMDDAFHFKTSDGWLRVNLWSTYKIDHMPTQSQRIADVDLKKGPFPWRV
ncbi:hypothetical protein BJX99DRAFT_265123 [Aspergillus californicus]